MLFNSPQLGLPRIVKRAASGTATATFGSEAHSEVAGSSFSFTSMAFNTATADRYIVAGITVGLSGSTSFSSVTIGGVSATQLYSAVTGNSAAAFYIAAVPTGTTGTVAVTMGGAQDFMGCFTWSVTGLSSTSVVDSKTSAADPSTCTINCNAGGIVFGVDFDNNGSSTWTWTGIAEDSDVSWPGRSSTAAHTNFASAQTGLTVTAQASTALSFQSFAAVSIGP